MRNIVITGASRGLGVALTERLVSHEDRAWLLSRTKPPGCDEHLKRWIPIDLAASSAISPDSLNEIGDEPIHLLIHNAGIWETGSFEETSPRALLDILNVNLASAVVLIRLLEPNLRAGRGNIIFVGSSWGLENSGTDKVASAASKFGLRGAAHALREHFRDDSVRVTCINPGWIGADDPLRRSEASPVQTRRPIPVRDVVELIHCISRLSTDTCVKEVVVTPTSDPDV